MGDDDDAGARALERIGDNPVDIGEQVAFVVTGLFREFEDASHPGADFPAHAAQPRPSRGEQAAAEAPQSPRRRCRSELVGSAAR